MPFDALARHLVRCGGHESEREAGEQHERQGAHAELEAHALPAAQWKAANVSAGAWPEERPQLLATGRTREAAARNVPTTRGIAVVAAYLKERLSP